MVQCNNCSHTINYKSVLKSIWGGYKPIRCDQCKSMLYVNKSTRLIFAALIPFPLLIQTQLTKLFGQYSFFAFFLWIVVIVSILPLVSRYSVRK